MKLKLFLSAAFILIGLAVVFTPFGELSALLSIFLLLGGIAGLLVLVDYPAEWIEDAFASISKHLKIPALIAGGSFLAISSSAPEFFTSVSGSIFDHYFEIGFVTILWSALFNICIIIGVCVLASKKREIRLDRQVLRRDFAYYAMTLIVFLLISQDGSYGTVDFLFLIVIYIGYLLWLSKDRSAPYSVANAYNRGKVTWLIVTGLAGVFIFSLLLVGYGLDIVKRIQDTYAYTVPITVLSALIFAAGTSIPDLMVSVAAIRKGEDSVGVINGISSNIFDLTICLGVPGLIYSLQTGKSISLIEHGLNEGTVLLGLVFASGLLLYVFCFREPVIRKTQGYIFIAYYCIALLAYISYELIYPR